MAQIFLFLTNVMEYFQKNEKFL